MTQRTGPPCQVTQYFYEVDYNNPLCFAPGEGYFLKAPPRGGIHKEGGFFCHCFEQLPGGEMHLWGRMEKITPDTPTDTLRSM